MLGIIARHTTQEMITLRSFMQSPYSKDASRVLGNDFNEWRHRFTTLMDDVQDAQSTPSANEAVQSPPGGTPVEEQLLVEVGVLGVPNSGKSTLTNALVGTKVSAVSAKTNTTVRSRLGAFTSGATQVVLFDTPGVVGPGKNMSPQIMKRIESAWKTASNCDILLLVIDAHRQLTIPDPRVVRFIESLKSDIVPGLSAHMRLPPTALVLNKVDMLHKEERRMLLPLTDDFKSKGRFEEVFWTSALRGQGVDELRAYLQTRGTRRGWLMPEDASTDAGEMDLAVEIVREKIFRAYYKEIPYEIVLNPVSAKTLFDGSARIEMDVVVRSDTLRMIVVGRQGAAIGSVGKAARLELEEMWKKRVHLWLNVKVDG